MSTKVVTGKVRFSFVHLMEPHKMNDASEPKYSVMLMIPKTDLVTVNKIKDAIKAAGEAGVSKAWGGKAPAVISNTFKDADVDTNQDGEVYANQMPETAGHYIINVSARAQHKPKVFDNGTPPNEIIDPSEIYSGCYGRASINFYAYNFNGKKGVSAGVLSVQKLEDGEPLGGPIATANDYA